MEKWRDKEALRELVLLAYESAASPEVAALAREALLNFASNDRAALVTLAEMWLHRSGYGVGEGLLALLLAPAASAEHVPSIHLVTFLDSAADIRTFDYPYDRSLSRRAAELKQRVADEIINQSSRSGSFGPRIVGILGETDQPILLDRLVWAWAGESRVPAWGTLTEPIRTNPHLPRPVEENSWVIILKERLDLVDLTDPTVVDVLLDGVENPPSTGAREACRRALTELPAGPSRERLCLLARTRPAARAVVREADWRPANEADHPLFFFLTRDLRAYTELDPTGDRLRAAYRRADPFVQGDIRKVVRELDAARKGGDAAVDGGKPGWSGHVTFDLVAFADDVGCGVVRPPAADDPGVGGARGRARRGSWNGGSGTSCGGCGGGCGGGGGC